MVQTKGQQSVEHSMPPKSGLAPSLPMECGLAASNILKSNPNTVGKHNLKQTDSEITTNTDIRTRGPSSKPVQLALDTLRLMGACCRLDPAGIGQGMQVTKNNANKDKEVGRETGKEMTNIQDNPNHTKQSKMGPGRQDSNFDNRTTALAVG